MMVTHKLFIAEIKRKIFILVPIDSKDQDDTAWRLAEGMTMPNPNDPEMEDVSECEEVITDDAIVDFDKIPMSGIGNTKTIKQLIESGDLEFKK